MSVRGVHLVKPRDCYFAYVLCVCNVNSLWKRLVFEKECKVMSHISSFGVLLHLFKCTCTELLSPSMIFSCNPPRHCSCCLKLLLNEPLLLATPSVLMNTRFLHAVENLFYRGANSDFSPWACTHVRECTRVCVFLCTSTSICMSPYVCVCVSVHTRLRVYMCMSLSEAAVAECWPVYWTEQGGIGYCAKHWFMNFEKIDKYIRMTEIRNFFTPVSLLPYARLFDSLSTNGDQCKSNYMQINRYLRIYINQFSNEWP